MYSPDNNCIYPAKFDEEKLVDNILIDELLPYILQLDEREDVCGIISSNRFGQPPVSKIQMNIEVRQLFGKSAICIGLGRQSTQIGYHLQSKYKSLSAKEKR